MRFLKDSMLLHGLYDSQTVGVGGNGVGGAIVGGAIVGDLGGTRVGGLGGGG